MSLSERLANAVSVARGDLSLRQAAEVSGIPYSTLHRIESGRMPDALTIAQLCKWTGLDANALLLGRIPEAPGCPRCAVLEDALTDVAAAVASVSVDFGEVAA